MEEKTGTGQEMIRRTTGGVFNDVELLSRAIKSLGEKHNLIMPGGAIGEWPPLHAPGISFVFANLETEVYSIAGEGGDKVGLAKTVLDRIAAAAGVRWNQHFCGRVDNDSSPHVVEYQASGTVLMLDGTDRPIHATKRIDLRAEKNTPEETWGSDAREIARIANDRKREPWPQILQARQHILSLAESKAKNRAIRSLGVRTSYQRAELAKGFAVLRLQFTGHSADPEVEREVSMMIARRALSSSSALYGGEDRHMTPAPLQSQKSVPRIVVQESKDEPEEDPGNGKPATEVKPVASPKPEKPAPAGQPPAEKTAAPQAPPIPRHDPLLICGKKDTDGKYPKKPASLFSAESLREKIAYTEKNKSKWDQRWAQKNQEDLDAMKAWLALKEYDSSQGELGLSPEADADEIPF